MRYRGFTLVEVLVSLAIFAVAATVLATAYLNVIGGYATLARRQQQEEDWNFVRSLVLTQPERTELEKGGRLTLPDGRPVSWTLKIEETEIADLFRVTLHTDAPAGGTNAAREPWEREQTFMLLRPTWSDAADRQQLRADLQQLIEKGRP